MEQQHLAGENPEPRRAEDWQRQTGRGLGGQRPGGRGEAGQLDDDRTYRAPVEPDALIKQLDELADWEPGGHEDCGWDGSWRWYEVIRDLRRRAERTQRYPAP
ncbi:hypothetical protein [Streptomyces sp. NPDC058412]|uniref:hypothetical protein n=1 Tax=Streptomyces sp. NPDC058412 TaxID=3346486 RepID=UPI00364D58C6